MAMYGGHNAAVFDIYKFVAQKTKGKHKKGKNYPGFGLTLKVQYSTLQSVYGQGICTCETYFLNYLTYQNAATKVARTWANQPSNRSDIHSLNLSLTSKGINWCVKK